MNFLFKRKHEINEWIITARWFYMVAVFFLGILGNSLMSIFDIELNFLAIGSMLLIFLGVNLYLFKVLLKVGKSQSEKHLRILSISNIAVELLISFVVLKLIGDESAASVFFYLPIISSAIIFGVRGSIITSIIAGMLLNSSVIIDYIFVIINFVSYQSILDPLQLAEIRYKSIDLVKTLVFSNFYLVIAVVSGYSSNLLFNREKDLMVQAEKLHLEKKKDEQKVERLDKNAALIAKRDKELKRINIELSKKVNELKKSEKSIIRAFSDLQAARKMTDEEKRKTAAIISNFIDPIVVLDNKHKINYLNPAAREIFGFIESDLGKEAPSENNYSMNNFREIIKKEFKVKTNKELKIDDPNIEEVDVNHAGKDLTYKVTTTSIRDNNQDLGVLKIFYNLTREKMIDKMKSEFISIAAHQLRTPLSAIKWVIKMVIDGDLGELNEEQYSMLLKGYKSNEIIIDLVNDMLNVSRIEEGRFGYDFKKQSIIDLLQYGINNVDNLVRQKNVKLEFNKADDIPELKIDKRKMNLAIQNLLENAVKYTPEYGKITVSVEKQDPDIIFKVKDNGVGIPEEDKHKIFSKFFRANNVIRMQAEGSGLGLFIVRNIIESHNGEIKFNSEEGKGTEFIVSLPINN